MLEITSDQAYLILVCQINNIKNESDNQAKSFYVGILNGWISMWGYHLREKDANFLREALEQLLAQLSPKDEIFAWLQKAINTLKYYGTPE